jgi:hypothetical protein
MILFFFWALALGYQLNGAINGSLLDGDDGTSPQSPPPPTWASGDCIDSIDGVPQHAVVCCLRERVENSVNCRGTMPSLCKQVG